MAQRIILRNGTEAAWTTANPILSLGEVGLETDTRKQKVGDGATAWASLAYSVSSGGGGSIDQTVFDALFVTSTATAGSASVGSANLATGAGNGGALYYFDGSLLTGESDGSLTLLHADGSLLAKSGMVYGDGSNLTGIDAAKITTGIIPAARTADGSVTLAKLANMATASFLARNTAGAGVPEVVSIATAKTMLSLGTAAFTAATAYEAAGAITTERSATRTLTNARITRRVTVPTYGTTTTVDSDASDVATITATGNITTLTISGTPTDGQVVAVNITASGADRTVALGSAFKIPSSSTVTSPITIASGTESRMVLVWKSATSKWQIVSLVPGY